MWEKLEGLKTYIVTLVTGGVAVVVQAMATAGFDWREIIPYQYQGYVGLGLTFALILGNLFLRKASTGPAKRVLPRKVAK